MFFDIIGGDISDTGNSSNSEATAAQMLKESKDARASAALLKSTSTQPDSMSDTGAIQEW